MPARKKTTISDIAIAAGVSKTTVSRYINGKQNMISAAACKRIEKAIHLSNYHPSAVARSLKTQRSYLIGVVIANITTPFATSLLHGISMGLRDAGYNPIFADAEDSPETELRLTESLMSHQVDGLIVNTTTEDNRNLIELSNAGTPIVLIDRFIRDHNFDIVLAPYSKPTIDLLMHAHDEGYRHIAMFTQPYEENSPRETRLNAFVQCDNEAFGVKKPMEDVYIVDPWDANSAGIALKKLIEKLKGDDGKLETCCILATNTVTMIATYNAIREMNLTIPDPIGLCGPDDWGWARRMGWDWSATFGKGISTYETDPEEMGKEAAKLVVKRIADPNGQKQQIYTPTTLHLRQSTDLKHTLH